MVYDTAINASLDGLIIFSVLANYCNDNVLRDFISRYNNIPVITKHLRSSIGNAILSNNAMGFTALMKHLIEKHHYTKIAFVKGPKHSLNAIECFSIYKSTLIAAGIPFNPALVAVGNFRYTSGQEAVRDFLDKRGYKPGRDLEVIVCANDTMAFGVIDELSDRGLNVPEDIAVTGFDNTAEWIFPKFPLTTVRQHLHEIGDKAVCSLLDFKPNQEPVYYDTELIIRASCGCLHMSESVKFKSGPEKKPENAERVESYVHTKDLEFKIKKIDSIIDNLKGLQKITELSSWMKSQFPTLGIQCAWVVLTSEVSSGIRTCRCIAGFDLQESGREEPWEEIPERSLFDDLLSEYQDRSFCILPLVFEDIQYGLLVIEVNKKAYLSYYRLSHHIGSTIKNMLLIEKVADMNQQLKRTNKQKTQFFINIAHETRTPLTLIQNYLALYLEKHQLDENLLIVKQNIDLLVANMLNFLDVEKLQKGESIYKHDSLVDLSKSARNKYPLFQAMAMKKQSRIILNVKDNVVIKIDPWALDRILNNLLDNAVKYIPTNGRINLDVRNEDGNAILRISDNGPGLPTNSFKHIFEPYYLLSKKNTGNQGVGVGLSIVKKIIDGLGAAIDVANLKEGGTCFTITFKDFSTATEGMLREITSTTPVTPLVQGKIKEKKIDEDKLSLLIVDDNIQLLKLMQTSLEELYNVFLAQSTPEALVKLKSVPRPDIIISDIMMEGPDGFQLLTALSKEEEYNDIPFIFLTALGREKDKLRGLDLGAVDYIEKPFFIAAIKAKIESIITLRKRQAKQDLISFRNKFDELFSSSDIMMEGNNNLRFKRVCNTYGIIGREREIIRLLMNGLVHKEIAAYLKLSRRTIEYHITKIYKKCGVKNKFDLLKKIQE